MNVSRRAFLAAAAGATFAGQAEAGFGKYIFGVVAPTRDFDNSVQYGFDYHEPSVFEVANMSDADYERFKDHVLSSTIRCRRMNFFTSPPSGFHLPAVRVVGPDVDLGAARAYAEKALPRCRELGTEIVVWGSAESRNVPDGFSRERAWAQIQDFLRLADPIARANRITIAIEPICTPSSNILNTGAEALKMLRELKLPNVKMTLDYYHMRSMREDPEILWTARKEIVHIHFANPNLAGNPAVKRTAWPKDPNEDPEYAHFFALLKKIGYAGGISIEARGTYRESAAAALAFFKRELS